jgi:hypothetical protein
MVGPGSLHEKTKHGGDRPSPNEPPSLAALQIRYGEAVREARKMQKDLLRQIERNQLDKRTRLDADSYRRFRHWVQDLSPEAPGITEELNNAEADLKRLGEDDLAFDVGMLGQVCSRIDTYRFLMASHDRKQVD